MIKMAFTNRVAFTFLLFLPLALGCGHHSATGDFQAVAEKLATIEKIDIPTVRVERGLIQAVAKPIGTLAPVHTTSAAAEVEGKIVAYLPSMHTLITEVNGTSVTRTLDIDIGCDVNEGEVLFEIDPVNYQLAVEQAEAALQLAKAQKEEYLVRGRRPEEIAQLVAVAQKMLSEANQAQAEYDRYLPVYKNGAVTQSEFGKIETELLVAQASLTAAQSVYELAVKGPNEQQIAVYDAQIFSAQAQLNIAHEKLAKTKVRAKYSGTITKRFKDLGDYVSVGNSVISYIDNHLLFADVSIPEPIANAVQRSNLENSASPTRQVKVYATGIAEPVIGSIDLVNQMIDSDSFAKRLRITIDNSAERLTPGGFIRAEIPLRSQENTLIVPKSAVIMVDGNHLAYVYHGNQTSGKLEQRRIQVGLANDTHIEVLDGLTYGEEIACQKLSILAEGMEVIRGQPSSEAKTLATSE